jgi:RNA polymerase sigma factor (sigma-70 family)
MPLCGEAVIGPADEGLARFCETQYPRLVAVLSLYCRDRFVAEELAQEALVRAVSNWPRVSTLQSPGGWVHRVAINIAHSWFRRGAAQARAMRRLAANQRAKDQDHETIVDVVLLANELARLPRRQREAIILRYVAGLPCEEVGVVLHCSPQAVRNLSHRGTTELRKRLEVTPEEVDDVR